MTLISKGNVILMSMSKATSAIQNKIPKHPLRDQNTRHPHHKIPVLRLMPEHLHAGDGADASAKEGGEEEGFLGDAPFVAAGPGFIDAHQGEGDEVDKDQVKDNRCG